MTPMQLLLLAAVLTGGAIVARRSVIGDVAAFLAGVCFVVLAFVLMLTPT